MAPQIDVLEEKLKIEKSFIPTITITTDVNKDNDRAVLGKIADNGLGIPEEVKEKIFDLFFTPKDVGKGTGLGLAISYEIIGQKHHKKEERRKKKKEIKKLGKSKKH